MDQSLPSLRSPSQPLARWAQLLLLPPAPTVLSLSSSLRVYAWQHVDRTLPALGWAGGLGRYDLGALALHPAPGIWLGLRE